jgi:pimeloyl-ACP methyl ester carboxylesterase
MTERLAPLVADVRSFFALTYAHAQRTRRGPQRGDGVPVLLIPGLMAGDWTMSRMAAHLERRGHPIIAARIGINVGCTLELVDRLEQRLRSARRRHARPLAVVGWSRGGTLAKLLTLRAPDQVASLITLASPNVDPRAVSHTVIRQVTVLSWLHALGARGVLGRDCLDGTCADTIIAELKRPFPAGIPYTSFYSRRDAVVDWRACCDPAAELIEVDDSHLGIGGDPFVLQAVGERLARIPAKAA